MIFVSFSGGLTSAYMIHNLLNKYDRKDLKFIFMNTGAEHPETYKFIRRCNSYFKLDLICLEPFVHHGKRKSSSHIIVDIDDLYIGTNLFKEMIKKYGLPNLSYPHCTRELKLRPFESFIRSTGLKRYKTAIGIRSDEIDRIPEDYESKGFIYPLANDGITKDDVENFWKEMPFTLNIPPRLGNCTFCYKKTDRKLRENFLEDGDLISQVNEIENSCNKGRKFFRKNRNMQEFLESNNIDDIYDSCQDGCELF